MPQIKALQILSTFTKDEFAKFTRFVGSAYFNRSKDLIKLNDFLKPYYPDFQDTKISYEKIYRKIYPGKKLNEGTVRNLFSEFNNLAEQFLAYVNYENTFEYGLGIVRETNARHLDKNFEKNYKKYFDINEKSEDRYYKRNLNRYFLTTEVQNYKLRCNKFLEKAKINNGAEDLLSFLLGEFLLERSSNLSVSDSFNLNRENDIVEAFFELTDVEKLIEKMKQNNSPNYKDIELCYYLNLAGENKNGNFYKDFQKAYVLFKASIDSMTKKAQRRMYVWIRNVINLNIKPDDTELRKIIFELGKDMVAKRVSLDTSGKMPASTFVNIVLTAIVAGEIGWAKEFLEKEIDTIEDDSKSDIYNYYKAKILSCEKKFAESNEQLLKVSRDDILFKADSKVLKMINYYELSYIEAAFSQAEAFKQFLIRSESISAGRKEKSSNFLKFYLSLLRKKSGVEVDIDFVKEELNKCSAIRNKNWLLSKAGEF